MLVQACLCRRACANAAVADAAARNVMECDGVGWSVMGRIFVDVSHV